MWRLVLFVLAAFGGFWLGYHQKKPQQEVAVLENIFPEKEYPITEHKSFTVILYAYNQSLWCERSLASVFEQDYDHYRVVFVDDGSTDGTLEKAKKFITENNQEGKVTLLRNEKKLGPVATLYRALDNCLDREVISFLNAKDWFTHPNVFNRINSAYQNPDVWITFSQAIEYPTYELEPSAHPTFYASLFKQIPLQDLFRLENYIKPITEMAGGRFRHLHEPLIFSNLASPQKAELPLETAHYTESDSKIGICQGGAQNLFQAKPASKQLNLKSLVMQAGHKFCGCPTQALGPPMMPHHWGKALAEPIFESRAVYKPLTQFPSSHKTEENTDILLFSYDRPLQLYACLESIQRYMSGYERLSVLYRASSPQFAAGYEQLKNAFPLVHFTAQSTTDPKHDFKPHVLQIVFDSPSKYILFGVDDIIVKDFVDLKLCTQQMQKTEAYGFYLRLGKHINHCYQSGCPQTPPQSLPLTHNIYAWDLKTAEADWGFPNSLDMTLFPKKQLETAFKEMKYKTPNSLEFNWTNEYAPKEAIGLCFETSKIVNIPMNVLSKTGNPHMNYLSTDELLAKFNQGLKIDIEPLYKIENKSPHIEYFPEFVLR